MKILIATGSFKDVFNPIEAAEVIRNALSPDNESVLLPFCDGGEYTYEVLKHNFSFYHEITALWTFDGKWDPEQRLRELWHVLAY